MSHIGSDEFTIDILIEIFSNTTVAHQRGGPRLRLLVRVKMQINQKSNNFNNFLFLLIGY